ncbi:hypothetical protein JW877_01530 [bacterium]|nr:hypothetical protein [bacterium]
MKKSFLFLLLATLMAYLIGCGGAGIDGNAPKTYGSAKEMVAEANMGLPEITGHELHAKVDAEEIFVLIDVREPDEFDEGNIPWSLNIPRGNLEFKIGDESFWDDWGLFMPEKNEEIVVYSHRGKRGALAAETLIKLGYTNVKNLKGGYRLWEDPDAEVEEEAPVSSGGCGG